MRGQVNSPVLAASCAALLIVLAFPIRIYCQQKAYSKRELVQTIRDNSKDNSISISDFARLITQNGVDFEMTPQDEAVFRKAGAVSEVIELIRTNFRPARSLVIRSTPTECQVLIDGQPRGTTGAAGTLIVRNLIGPHKVTLRKQNYHDDQRAVVVTPNGLVESFLLSPLPGKLNISVDTEGAHINIRNVGDYSNSIANLELPAGSYDVEVSKPGYRPQSKTILLAAGAPYSWPVTLKKMSIDEMVAEANRLNCPAAISLIRVILATQPEQPKANYRMGQCEYELGAYDDALPYIKRAILGGEPFPIQVLHRHGHAGNKNFSQARLTLHRESFDLLSNGYPDESFTNDPYDKITAMNLKDVNRHLSLKIRVKLPKDKKETEHEVELYSTDAQVAVVANQVRGTDCSQCATIMGFVLQLLQQFR